MTIPWDRREISSLHIISIRVGYRMRMCESRSYLPRWIPWPPKMVGYKINALYFSFALLALPYRFLPAPRAIIFIVLRVQIYGIIYNVTIQTNLSSVVNSMTHFLSSMLTHKSKRYHNGQMLHIDSPHRLSRQPQGGCGQLAQQAVGHPAAFHKALPQKAIARDTQNRVVPEAIP